MPLASDHAASSTGASSTDAAVLAVHMQWMQAVAQSKDREAFHGLFAYYGPRITDFPPV